MALYRYFKKADRCLPDPTGPLSREIPSSISKANEEVDAVLNRESGKRGPYLRLTSEEKAQIGKMALENGAAATVRSYAKKFPGLKESSIRTWRDTYRTEVRKRRRSGNEDPVVAALPKKKMGRPLLFGEELEKQVKS